MVTVAAGISLRSQEFFSLIHPVVLGQGGDLCSHTRAECLNDLLRQYHHHISVHEQAEYNMKTLTFGLRWHAAKIDLVVPHSIREPSSLLCVTRMNTVSNFQLDATP